MTAPTKLDVEDVRAELHVDDVIRHASLRVRRRGSQFRMKECPRCHETSSSEAIAIDSRTGRWIHHGREREAGGECSGDLLDLLAACEGLDAKRDFARLLPIAAKLAGVEARALTDEERAQRRAYREQQAAERQRRADEEDAAIKREALTKAGATWQRFGRVRRNLVGQAYLRSRGLDPAPLIEADLVRFDLLGNIAVPLWCLEDSELVNVVSRLVSPAEGDPKVVGLSGCPTAGTLCGRVADIDGSANVIIAEGVVDTLTAIQLWPGRVVLGAHGAGRMTAIAETVAPLVAAKGCKLVLVPDGDDVGQRCAIRAGEAALAAGLEMDKTLIVVELDAHPDLNAAYAAGWKP